MIAIVHSIYSQSVHAPALNVGLMDNDAERYCSLAIVRLQKSDYSIQKFICSTSKSRACCTKQ